MKAEAIEHELNFWRGFVKDKRFIEGWVGDCKTPDLVQSVADFIKETLPPGGSVLDAGSGVVSILNGTVPNDQLIYCDPLAMYYREIFNYDRYSLRKPYPIAGEELINYDWKFDIVHISNALDHTQDPRKAFEGLLHVTKPGGHLIVQGFENEADAENWEGFHQWNLSIDGSHILVRGKDRVFHLSGAFDVVKLEPIPRRHMGKTWFIYIVQKK